MLSTPILVIGGRMDENGKPSEAVIQFLERRSPFVTWGEPPKPLYVCTNTGITTYPTKEHYIAWQIERKARYYLAEIEANRFKGFSGRDETWTQLSEGIWPPPGDKLIEHLKNCDHYNRYPINGITFDRNEEPREVPYSKILERSQLKLALKEVEGQFGRIGHISCGFGRIPQLYNAQGEHVKSEWDGPFKEDEMPFPIRGFPDAIAIRYEGIPIYLRTKKGDISVYPGELSEIELLTIQGWTRPENILGKFYVKGEYPHIDGIRARINEVPLRLNYAVGHLTPEWFIPNLVSVSSPEATLPHFVVRRDLETSLLQLEFNPEHALIETEQERGKHVAQLEFVEFYPGDRSVAHQYCTHEEGRKNSFGQSGLRVQRHLEKILQEASKDYLGRSRGASVRDIYEALL